MWLRPSGYVTVVTDARRPMVHVTPTLVASEIEFLAGFASDGAVVRRVWPGQPSHHCPWRPASDGSGLELDVVAAAADPERVAGWLRFLTQEFLAPSSVRSLTVALVEGLRGGHQMSGAVVFGAEREIRIDHNRITERVLPTEYDTVVLRFDDWRREPIPDVVRADDPECQSVV